MAIYITGSLAYDRVMNFPGVFSDYIQPDKVRNLNVCFHIESLKEERGGTGGNIAYGLALLGESASILACVGKDFGPYREYLEQIGIDLQGVRTLEDELTASAYITADSQSNQITIFNEAAMSHPCAYDFAALDTQKDLAIIAPTLTEDMTRHARLYTEKKLGYIFDPGQQLTTMSADDVLAGISGAQLLVSNDYELGLICRISGLDLSGILALTPVVITTLGALGSRISRADGSEVLLDAVPVLQVQDPTGAGDAYRAGLIKGLRVGMSLEHSVCLGSACAAFCVEKHGAQGYYFDHPLLAERFEKTYNLKFPFTFTSNIHKGA